MLSQLLRLGRTHGLHLVGAAVESLAAVAAMVGVGGLAHAYIHGVGRAGGRGDHAQAHGRGGGCAG